ncbi:polysaccharide biosynthesis protein [Vibrio rumoiensis]|uniref:Nucleoside-diphosphate sugar epimerase n=1 Tax=Vibrio rumoiensis 1S-45 TaxID=1188252 RepID=A0A1E5E3G7_9VIBR|nr:nucleoside-diphosphate sugar epimerase/dehydratase [Vibrio rumoiensis]OEF25940.1 nucleoside-diphosphate sugar epimerase [Vibrio rumoiensis 1S-45]
MQKFNYIWGLPRPVKRIISLLIDSFFITVAFYFAHWIRLADLSSLDAGNHLVLISTIPITLLIFTKLGLYRAILRYLNFKAIINITFGSMLSALLIILFAYFYNADVPRSIPFIYAALMYMLCGGSRMFIRNLTMTHLGLVGKREPVLIYGAGDTGRQLALLMQPSNYKVVGFIDQDPTLANTVISGIAVYAPNSVEALIAKYKIKKVLLAVPSATRIQRRDIINTLLEYPLEVQTVPAMIDIVTGKTSIDQLIDVPIEDLLGREAVVPDSNLLQSNIKDQVVMVTGAGGSIGSELCRQIIKQQPKTLVLFELSEFGLYAIDKELTELVELEGLSVNIVPLLGSVQRINRLVAVMSSFQVDTVYHAAAYKHVPLVEYNVVEGVRNNVFGTYYTAKAAIETGVKNFVLISTDKAVRPTNVMGATKRMAELGLQALAEKEMKKKEQNQPFVRFSMVRFGNVLGSSGSVIPLFKRQIKLGGPITITHPEIIRYFMTIPEAAQLVIQAGAMGKGGDVFVLDMGEPVKIVDLATNLVHLSGLDIKSEDNPNGDIEFKFTGLRPGEKLFEELLIGDDGVQETEHNRIMTANEVYWSNDKYCELMGKLDTACHEFNHEEIRQLLLEAPTGFNPSDCIGDLVWQARSKENKAFPVFEQYDGLRLVGQKFTQ